MSSVRGRTMKVGSVSLEFQLSYTNERTGHSGAHISEASYLEGNIWGSGSSPRPTSWARHDVNLPVAYKSEHRKHPNLHFIHSSQAFTLFVAMPPTYPPLPKSFVTQTGKTFEEKKSFWRRTVKSNPARIVSVISLSGDRPTSEHGDTVVDIFPALQIVMETARGDERPGSRLSSTWDRLIDAGVADVLCELVINMKLHPDTPKVAMPMAVSKSFDSAKRNLSTIP
jgi:hypothetical protein